MKSETHGAEDVPVFSQGPWSHLFIGTMKQHTIAHKMAYAACWGAYKNRDGCQSIIISTVPTKFIAFNGSYRLTFNAMMIIVFLIFL